MLLTISFMVALVITIIVVFKLAILNIIIGTFYFLFGNPKIKILKTASGPFGFAFAVDWNNSRNSAKFDLLKISLFNPFGDRKKVSVLKQFSAQTSSFAKDLDMGVEFRDILNCNMPNKSRVCLEVFSNDGFSLNVDMSASKFLERIDKAVDMSEKYNLDQKNKNCSKTYYHSVSVSKIANKSISTSKSLKIASNPTFSSDFSPEVKEGEEKSDFTISKLWIESGCIICNACSDIIPEVFEVPESGSIVKPSAPLDKGLLITEAAEACPVEIIKFEKAS